MEQNTELRTIAEKIVYKNEGKLVQLTLIREKQGLVLRLLVEKSDANPLEGSGVDHNMCARISKELGDIIEEKNLIDKAFVLEVSSPGIDRPLVVKSDYARFKEQKVKIKTKTAIDGKKRFSGILMGIENEIVNIKISDKKGMVQIPYETIAKANLVFDQRMLKTYSGEK
jgi:ribosome maturation factor RimP